MLIHGYAVIDNELVWEVATTRVRDLAALLGRLLGEDETA
ncbi:MULTISPECIES: HepT-like ribonuclease domain-containing protein [Rhodococcus]